VLRRAQAGWTEEQLIQPTADAGALAGAAVAIDGDVLVVGAPRDAADDSGRAYVYRRDAVSNTWVLDAGGTLAATTPQASANCGRSVAVSGTEVIIGCPGEKGSGNKTSVGAVYMFRFDAASSAWVGDGTLKGANTSDVFGSAVALSGTTAVVGAPQEANATTLGAGGVHVLVRGASSWSQQGSTLRGDVVAGADFGAAVAISVDRIVVGAPGDGSGCAYMFQRTGGVWSLDGAKLVPDLPAPGLPEFGAAVAIDGMHAVIGAPTEDSTVSSSGAVHAYRRDSSGWTTTVVVNADTPSTSRLGASVALDGEWIAAGAPEESSVQSVAGAVYVFR
jgi:hypothetical protein